MFMFQRQTSTNDRVIFENIPDQYLKGEDITVHVTLPQSLATNSDEDEIGLIRTGSTNIKQCLIRVPVQFETSTIRGTATFAATELPLTNDEFYQFWYIRNQSKNLGSSLPFQLNCTSDDMDFLTDVSQRKNKTDSLGSLFDHEGDDIVVINSKGKSNENESSDNAKDLEEMARMRSQLNTMTQFTIDQASKIVDYERRLIQTEQLLKQSNEDKQVLEQRLRDSELTSEKRQRSLNDQLKSYANQIAQRDKQIRELEEANQLLHAKFSRVVSQTKSVRKIFLFLFHSQIFAMKSMMTMFLNDN